MKTRYSALVSLKKNTLDKSERILQRANADLKNASNALELSYAQLSEVDTPVHGNISALLASRILLSSQRDEIEHNKEWVAFTQEQRDQAQLQLKKDMIEYEKFKYLELEEIKKVLRKQKIEEVKNLDEIASMTFFRNK